MADSRRCYLCGKLIVTPGLDITPNEFCSGHTINNNKDYYGQPTVDCNGCTKLRTELEAVEAKMQIYKEYAEVDMCTEENAIASGCGKCQEFYKKLTSMTKGGK